MFTLQPVCTLIFKAIGFFIFPIRGHFYLTLTAFNGAMHLPSAECFVLVKVITFIQTENHQIFPIICSQIPFIHFHILLICSQSSDLQF